jgi:hypothetical protein
VYGLELISKSFYSVHASSPQGFTYYVYDGHGSVRALTNSAGAVTDTYDYDAFGVLLHSSTTQCANSSGTITTVTLGAACPAGSSSAPTPNNSFFLF